MPEDDVEDEVMKAFLKSNNDEGDACEKLKSLNKLAPDDATSLSGRR